MDGNSFVDIFATKGIEYLLVIGFLILFILFMRYLLVDGRKAGSERGKKGHEGTH